MESVSYLEFYQEQIAPQLREIDVFLKTSDYPMDVTTSAGLLGMTAQDIAEIMESLGLIAIDRAAFLEIMKAGDSTICQMFSRETELGSPPTYTHEQIAYIYGLDKHKVKHACDRLKIGEATPFTMPMVFSQITM